MSLSRRQFVGMMTAGAAVTAGTAASAALVGLTPKGGRPLAGGFDEDDMALGHRLRDGGPWTPPARTERVPVVIVGGGIAGLSALWQLERSGVRDVVLLEFAREAGGNARGGQNAVSRYPWAAHYLPVPDTNATHVRELCEELGLLRNGAWEERHLCFAPQERLFIHGAWRSGVEPTDALAPREREEFERFDGLIHELRASGRWRIPMETGRPDPALDRVSFREWLDRAGFRSPALRWYLEYGVRDDYGASLERCSAWAGLHYSAARPAEELGPLTWPDGTGWIVRRLLAKLGRHVRTGEPAVRVQRAGRGWEVLTPRTRWLADAVIMATPLAVARRLVEGAPPLDGLEVSPWLVANLTLARWPAERGTPPAWDNVIHGSPSLGYVNATHQSLDTHRGATVWTWYLALAHESPHAARQRLLRTAWRDWTEYILADLERAHPDIRRCVTRIDIRRHPHAMARPVPGWLTSPARAAYLKGAERLVYAHADLSGTSIFEEAQYRGVMAAERVRRLIG